MHSPLVKICGISDVEALQAASDAGADFVGFVHFRKSPRHVTIEQLLELIRYCKQHKVLRGDLFAIKSVVVLVNPDDVLLDDIFAHAAPDYLQLHGDEAPERVQEIKTKYNTSIIKAIKVGNAADVALASAYADIADIILFDAKPPEDAANEGGLGVCFDWGMLKNIFPPQAGGLRGEASENKTTSPPHPPVNGGDNIISWALSGGLSAENVAQALAIANAPMVDVSSHVETPVGSGRKDSYKIRAFIRTAKKS